MKGLSLSSFLQKHWRPIRQPTLRTRLALWISALLAVLNVVLIAYINITSATVVSATRSAGVMPLPAEDGMDDATRAERIAALISISEEATLVEVRHLALIGVAVAVSLGGLGTYWIVGRVLQPVQSMARTARDISASKLHTRLALQGPNDEIKQLADAFDVMLDRLDGAFNQQSRFISNAAHELRTPLAAMRANLDVVQSDPQATMNDYQEMVEAVGRSLERLEHMVTDLLLLAREERSLTFESLSLDLLISEVLEDLDGLADACHVKLRLSRVVEVSVCGNAALLARVFGNLVENGIRYNRTGGEVTVAVRSIDDWAVITVADTGVGIPLRDQ
ncbi:MAG: HAMP domain-containing protein, partial [Chloroflexi bacterium]|nr:HAMP domain-containing protein [Chloroflexota bacterium]